MSTSLESFVNVLKRSGLVEEPVIAKSLDVRQDLGDAQTGENFAEFLVEKDVITAWQAAKLLQGKHKGFFLGKYKLLRLLGKGGMSSVYLAEHVLMRRRCAIKVLPWKLVKDSSYLQRFHREAQAVAALDHPNIVRAYDIDHEKDGNLEIHFLVMEYVEGRNLFDLVQIGGPLPATTAADYIRQGALGLAHAHKAGMVHRDVKPGNFIVDQHGTVKLMDLGLARVAADDADHSLTIAHDERVLGTADYLAPEQAVDSHLVDTRADLYSLGCTMYFLLTGRPPFNEGTLTQRLLAHQTKEPTPIESIRPDLPESLLVIIRSLMVKDRDHRLQSADEAAAMLGQWLGSQNGDALPAPQNVAPFPVVDSQAETPRPSAANASTELPTKKLQRADAGGLGDFLSSLSDVEPAAEKQRSSQIRKRAKSSPRMQAEVSTENMQEMDIAGGEQPFSRPAFPDSGVFPNFPPTTASGSSNSLRTGDSAKTSRQIQKKTLRDIMTPELIAQLGKYRYYAIGGVVLLLLLGYLLFGRSGTEKQGSAVTAPTTVPGETPTTSAPAKNVRPSISGGTITVGPQGNFGTLSEAIQYIQDNAYSSSGTPVRVIQIAEKQTLKESISIDKSGLGSFPRGVRIVGTAKDPPRLQSTGKAPVISLNAVDGITLENIVVDCRGLLQAIQLQGFMAAATITNVRFENIEHAAISGSGFSGLGDQPAIIQNCSFIGAAKSARAIQLEPGSGQDARDLIIRGCRFLGPLENGVSIQGGADTITFSQNVFHEAATAIVLGGQEPVQRQLTFVNNTFHACGHGIVFKSGPAPSARKFTFQKNLFIGGTGPDVSIERDGTRLDQLTREGLPTQLNWTDRTPSTDGELNIFAAQGRTGATVKFVSENPAEAGFLKPDSTELQSVATDAAPPKFIGAIAPR